MSLPIPKTCKLDSECTTGTAGGCCTYAKLAKLGTPNVAEGLEVAGLILMTGLTKEGESTHFC